VALSQQNDCFVLSYAKLWLKGSSTLHPFITLSLDGLLLDYFRCHKHHILLVSGYTQLSPTSPLSLVCLSACNTHTDSTNRTPSISPPRLLSRPTCPIPLPPPRNYPWAGSRTHPFLGTSLLGRWFCRLRFSSDNVHHCRLASASFCLRSFCTGPAIRSSRRILPKATAVFAKAPMLSAVSLVSVQAQGSVAPFSCTLRSPTQSLSF